MHRRHFLRCALALPALGLLPYGRPRAATADRTLVVVFQRGGCDGLNALVPYGDPDYQPLRPTIAIPSPGMTARSAIDLDGFFGFNPALSPLADIYFQGELAAFPAVHYKSASRSHFDSQALIESASTEILYDGWLNRYLQAIGSSETLRAAAFGTRLPHALEGPVQVSTIAELGGGLTLPPDYKTELFANLRQVFGQSVKASDVNRLKLHRAGNNALDILDLSGDLDPGNYSPQYGAQYPETHFGRQMIQAAQLIKAGLGSEVLALEMGGWDTHADQGGVEETGYQSGLFTEFANTLAAFHRDLTDYRDQVLLLTMTEFGRTAKENASGGTDHGNASCWLALGKVTGGIHGTWPGLSPTDLYQKRYLRHTIDYRNLMGEVMTRHLGFSDLSRILPGHTYQPVGFL